MSPVEPFEGASVRLAGEVDAELTMHGFAELLTEANLDVQVGTYSIRVCHCSHFVFREFDLPGGPVVDADAESLDQLLRDSELVSKALTLAKVRHRFEVYGPDNNEAGYRHFEWPR